MVKTLRAAIGALAVTGLWALAMFGPVDALNLLGLIAVMLPLSVLDGLGVPGLGYSSNGFFVPSQIGYVLGAFVIWFIWFLLIAGAPHLIGSNRGTGSHG